MAFAILRTEKIKSIEKLVSIAAHHFRTRHVKNADAARTINNHILVGCDQNLLNAACMRIGDRKIRKNGVVAIEVLMTASPEYFRDNPTDYGVFDQDKTNLFNRRALEFLNAEFGCGNVVSAISHIDEATPHIHAVVVPIDPDSDRLNASRWLDGKVKLSALQDRFFEHMKVLGLERGLKGSDAEHITIQQYYAALQIAKSASVPLPEVTPPPLMVTQTNRDQWATSESMRLAQAQRPYLSAIEVLAATTIIHRDKAKQAQKTAKKIASELDQTNAVLKTRKDVELQRLLEKMRAKRTELVGQYLINGQSIFIDGQDFIDSRQQFRGVGSIDLLMHIERYDYHEALSWLGKKFSPNEAMGAATAKAQRDAENAIQQVVTLPVADESLWPLIREHLVMECGLNQRSVDRLHERYRLFAATIQDEIVACFAFRNNQQTTGVELLGIKSMGCQFQGFRGEQSGVFQLKNKSPEGVIFVDSAVEALALHALKSSTQLSAYKEFDVVALADWDISACVYLAKQYRRIVAASLFHQSWCEQFKEWIPNGEFLLPEHGNRRWFDYVREKINERRFSPGTVLNDKAVNHMITKH